MFLHFKTIYTSFQIHCRHFHGFHRYHLLQRCFVQFLVLHLVQAHFSQKEILFLFHTTKILITRVLIYQHISKHSKTLRQRIVNLLTHRYL